MRTRRHNMIIIFTNIANVTRRERLNCGKAHMSEEAAGHHGSVALAGLQLREEVVTVEVVQLLQVAKDDAPLASQVLGDVGSVHQGEVVGEDVGQRTDVLPLGEQQLLQDSLQPPVQTDGRRSLNLVLLQQGIFGRRHQ